MSRPSNRIECSQEAFLKFVEFEPNSGCWLWSGANVHRYGYKRWTVDGVTKQYLAHRIAWLIFHGSWPRGEIIHRCDTPECVNPDHLRVGTHAQNMADMVQKGRSKKRPRWTEETRRAVLDHPGPNEAIARDLGVHVYSVYRARKHLLERRRLTTEEVLRIKGAAKTPLGTLAAEFGVSVSAIKHIRYGQTHRSASADK